MNNITNTLDLSKQISSSQPMPSQPSSSQSTKALDNLESERRQREHHKEKFNNWLANEYPKVDNN